MTFVLLMISIVWADSGDTGTCDPSSNDVSASYYDGMCVTDLASFCEGECPSWAEVVASYADDSRCTLLDCGAGSDVAHKATRTETDWGVERDFDADGNMVGAVVWNDAGIGYCCEGQTGSAYGAGLFGVDAATCLPSEDTADSAPPDPGCGCATGSPDGRTAVMFAGLLVVGLRRGGGWYLRR